MLILLFFIFEKLVLLLANLVVCFGLKVLPHKHAFLLLKLVLQFNEPMIVILHLQLLIHGVDFSLKLRDLVRI